MATRDTTSVSAAGVLSVVQIELPDRDETWVADDGTISIIGAGVIGGTDIGTDGAAGTIYSGYTLAAGDDFDAEPSIWRAEDTSGRYKASTATRGRRTINTTEYQYYWDENHWGHGKADFYAIPGLNPFSVADSVLTITATGASGATQLLHDADWITTQGYTSGHLTTAETFQYRFGILEFRAKQQLGDGQWGALWTLNNERPYNGGTESGWEFFGNGDFQAYLINEAGSPAYDGRNTSVDTTDGFHVYTLKWYLNGATATLVWYVDGVVIRTVADANVAAMDRTRYFIMNLALSTNWNGGSGAPDAGQFPLLMEVDWWRYWKPTAATTIATIADDFEINAVQGGAISQVIPAFFAGHDTETVLATWDNVLTPGNGGSAAPGNIAFPSGMTWTSATRTLAWDNPVGSGRLFIGFFGWNTAGGIAAIRHVYIDLPPTVEGAAPTTQAVTVGVAFNLQPLTAIFIPGNLPPTVTAALVAGGAIPSWMVLDPVTHKVSGTAPAVATTSVRFTVTTLAGSVTSDLDFVATSFSDTFNRANADLEASSNWTLIDGEAAGAKIVSNVLQNNTIVSLGTAYASPNVNAVQFVQAKFLDSGAAGVIACMLTNKANWLGVRWNVNTIEVLKSVAGTRTIIATYTNTFGATKVLRLETDQATFTVKVDGSLQTLATGSQTISSGPPTSNRMGIVARLDGTKNKWDDFSAGVP